MFNFDGAGYPTLASGDYQSVEMKLVFGTTTTQHTVNISITDDSLLETNESFVLELYLISLVPNVMVYPNFTTVTIVDNEGQFAAYGNIIVFMRNLQNLFRSYNRV